MSTPANKKEIVKFDVEIDENVDGFDVDVDFEPETIFADEEDDIANEDLMSEEEAISEIENAYNQCIENCKHQMRILERKKKEAISSVKNMAKNK